MTVRADDYMSGLSAGRTGTGGFFGSSGSSSQDPLIYWAAPISSVFAGVKGSTKPPASIAAPQRMLPTTQPPASIAAPGTPRPAPPPSASTKPVEIGASAAIQEFYSWSASQRTRWGQHLASLGLIEDDEVTDYHLLEKWWKQIVADAVNLRAGGHKLTPFQIATLVAGGEEGAAARRAGAAARQPFSGTKTQTSTSVDLTDPTTARVLVNSVLKEALGRAANPEEVAAFTATLNAAERNNPIRTTTNSTYRADELVSQSSQSEGGLSGSAREQIVADQAMQKPEYGAYQAATYYFNALASAIQSPV